MALQRDPFYLCKIFFDETKIKYKGENLFAFGAILLPIDSDLSAVLGRARKKHGFTGTLHFSEIKKGSISEIKTVRAFLSEFVKSTAVFRVILVRPSTWENIDSHRSRAKLAGLLLSHPYMPCEGKVYKTLSKARIIFDRQDLSKQQEREFFSWLNKVLKKNGTFYRTEYYPVEDAAIVFSDKRIFYELQLIDLLLGVFRISYLVNDGAPVTPHRKDIHDGFLRQFKGLGSFVNVTRGMTGNKLDIWDFKPKRINSSKLSQGGEISPDFG